jgi:hypothetical protein
MSIAPVALAAAFLSSADAESSVLQNAAPQRKKNLPPMRVASQRRNSAQFEL